MKIAKQKTQVLMLLGLIACTFATGCASSNVHNAKPLSITKGENVSLEKYNIVTFVPFEVAANAKKPIDKIKAVEFTEKIANRIEYNYPSLFQEIRKGEPLGQTDEVIITGTITEYEAGNKFGRAMLIGVGAAGFKGNMIAKDASTDELLFEAKIDKLWAWGGWAGASKGIEEMVDEAAASAAKTIVVKKNQDNQLTHGIAAAVE